MWPFSKKVDLSKGVPIIDQMTNTLVRLHEVGNLGYALVGVSTIAILVAIIAALTSKALLDSIVQVVPWIFGFVITFGSFGVILLCIERIAALRLAEAKMKFIMSMAEEAIKASIPKDTKVDSAQVTKLFNDVLAELWKLESPKPSAKPT